MAQFDIVENTNKFSRREFPYALVLQHSMLDDLRTVVSAPLQRASGLQPLTKLNIHVDVAGAAHLVLMNLIAAVDRQNLGATVQNMEDRRTEIIRAYDIIISGI